jgi:hypothetical protein
MRSPSCCVQPLRRPCVPRAEPALRGCKADLVGRCTIFPLQGAPSISSFTCDAFCARSRPVLTRSSSNGSQTCVSLMRSAPHDCKRRCVTSGSESEVRQEPMGDVREEAAAVARRSCVWFAALNSRSRQSRAFLAETTGRAGDGDGTGHGSVIWSGANPLPCFPTARERPSLPG